MRDAVSLLKKVVIIDEQTYKIVDFYHVHGNPDVFVKLRGKKGLFVNYKYKELQTIIKEQRLK